MRPTLRSYLLFPVLIALAAGVFYLTFKDRLANERASCAERGGRIEAVNDSRAPGLVYECVLPGGSRERL
jgi:putative hemolysin